MISDKERLKQKKEELDAEMEKRRAGAPLKYKPQYCKDLIAHLKKGGSVDSFGAYLGGKYGEEHAVSPSTVFNWLNAFPDFMDAREVGMSYSRLFFEEIGNMGMTGQLKRTSKEIKMADGTIEKVYAPAMFNDRVWNMNMKNRFGWKDRQETEITSPDGSMRPTVIISLPSNGKEKKT